MAELSRALAAEVAQDVDGPLPLRGGLGQRLPFLARHFLAQRRERAFEDLGGLE